jgi:hypothetical protein
LRKLLVSKRLSGGELCTSRSTIALFQQSFQQSYLLILLDVSMNQHEAAFSICIVAAAAKAAPQPAIFVF